MTARNGRAKRQVASFRRPNRSRWAPMRCCYAELRQLSAAIWPCGGRGANPARAPGPWPSCYTFGRGLLCKFTS